MPNEQRLGNLLIVDDEPGIIEILSEILQPITSNIKTADNGRSALKIFETSQVDAILSDINMPTMNGLLFLTEVRQKSLLIPFVILTAFGDRENLLEALRLNATDFLEKPFNNADVIRVVKEALSFGVMLKEFEKELDQAYNHLPIPADEIIQKKNLKKALLGMKYGRKSP